MIIWTIYKHPSDYPGKYVARQFLYGEPGAIFLVADTLKQIRAKIPPEMLKLPRDINDDPVIVESYI